MALRKRSYKNRNLILTYLHNSKVSSRRSEREREAKSKVRDRERDGQRRADEKTDARREQIETRFLAVGIDPEWSALAMKIMDQYGYGLNQINSKVLPLLEKTIASITAERERQSKIAAEIMKMKSAAVTEIESAYHDVYLNLMADIDSFSAIFDEKRHKLKIRDDVHRFLEESARYIYLVQNNAFRNAVYNIFVTIISIIAILIVGLIAVGTFVSLKYSDGYAGFSLIGTLLLVSATIWLRIKAFRIARIPKLVFHREQLLCDVRSRLSQETLSVADQFANDQLFNPTRNFELEALPPEIAKKAVDIRKQLRELYY